MSVAVGPEVPTNAWPHRRRSGIISRTSHEPIARHRRRGCRGARRRVCRAAAAHATGRRLAQRDGARGPCGSRARRHPGGGPGASRGGGGTGAAAADAVRARGWAVRRRLPEHAAAGLTAARPRHRDQAGGRPRLRQSDRVRSRRRDLALQPLACDRRELLLVQSNGLTAARRGHRLGSRHDSGRLRRGCAVRRRHGEGGLSIHVLHRRLLGARWFHRSPRHAVRRSALRGRRARHAPARSTPRSCRSRCWACAARGSSRRGCA